MSPPGLLCQPQHRRLRSAALGAVLMVAVGTVMTAASPAARAATRSSDLFVTSPPSPILAKPGTTATTTLTVGDLGHSKLDVTISTRSVELLNNGKTRFGTGPDSRFAGRIAITPETLSLSPREERKVKIAVAVPAGLAPGDYFLGFLVSPIINSASVAVENDIGGLVIVDLPGARDLRLAGSFVGPSSLDLSFTSSAAETLRTESTGSSTVSYTTTVEKTGWPSPTPSYLEVNAELLPPGLSRTTPVGVSSWLGIGWYTFHATLVFDRTANGTGEVTVSRSVFILNPLWFLVFPVILALLFWNRARRRRGKRRGLHYAGRPAVVTKQNRRPVPVG